MPYFLYLFPAVGRKINVYLLRQNKKLNHKNPEDNGNEIILIKFNGNQQWNCQENIS